MARDLLKDYTYGGMLATSGYDVDFAVGTTYSMNPKALLIVPLSLGMFSDVNEATRNSQMFLLESIRRSADKFVLFCNRGSIHMPQEVQSFMPLLESCIYEIQNKYKPLSNFHPKVWILREVNRENPDNRQIKIVVMSRNLTLDSNLDMVVSLTGKIDTENSRNSKRHQPLADFLNKLANRIPIPDAPDDKTAKQKRANIRQLAKDLFKVKRFDVDEDTFEKDSYEFIPMLFGENLNKDINLDDALQGEQLMAITPFLQYDVLENMNRRITKCDSILVTTSGYVDEKVFDLYNNKENRSIYVMKEAAKDNDIMPTDLHAKTYLVNNPRGEWGYYLYVGSANATGPAFHANSEFILRLKYKPGKHYVFDTFRKEFLMMDDKDEESLLFEKVYTAPEETEKHEASEVEQFMRQLVVGDFSAECFEVEDGNFTLRINTSVKTGDYNVTTAPLQAPNCEVKLEDGCEIKGLPLSMVSEFYILKVHGDEEMTKVVKIPTRGIPTQDRDIAIYRSVINNKDKFLNYVSFMLSDDPETFLFELEQAQKMFEKHGEGGSQMQLPQRIYEQMLKIAYSNPKRIEMLDEIIEKVDNEEYTRDFKRVYEVFKKATGRI